MCHPFQREQFCTTRRNVTVIVLMTGGVLALHSIQAYFWQYDTSSGDCGVRTEVSGSTWTVFSWITELLVFGVVPVAILTLNACVIVEMRRLSAAEVTNS